MLSSLRQSVRGLVQRFEIDRAVLYAMSARGWQFVAGPVTLWLIADYFSAEVRGYFYTFGSVLAIQLFFELGLHTILVNQVSHQWALLRLTDEGSVTGDSDSASRLASLIRFVERWYSACAVLFAVCCGIGGHWFFTSKQSEISWQYPWLCLVIMAGVSFRLTPCFTILEGCGQVREVNRMRFSQAVCGNLAVWVAILMNGQLWACVVAATVRLVWEFRLVGTNFRRIRTGLAGFSSDCEINWKENIWPLQWRIAIQSVSLWFAMHLFTIVTFEFHGEAAGGRMGMTWSIATAIQAAAMSWVATRIPVFGKLIAENDFAALDRLFKRMAVYSSTFIAIASTGVVAAVLFLNSIESRYATCLLDPLPTALIFLGIGVNHLIFCQAVYVRAHRTEPFLILTTSVNLMIGLSVWVLGERFGAIGAISGWLTLSALLYLPLHSMLWARLRRELHS